MHRMEWDDARYVLAIHREVSLSRAGKKLGVNQSTVGRRLEAIEADLGARLFFRTREGYVLTPEGEGILSHAERMEDEAHAIVRKLGGREVRLSGTVRITGPEPFSAKVLVPILAKLHALYPDIDLELVADNRSLSLTKREADIAVRMAQPTEAQLIVRKVSDFRGAAYASPTYLAARGHPQPPDLDGHDFIADEPMNGPPADYWLTYRGGKGRTVFRSQSTLACMAAAMAGIGILLLPCYLGDEEPGLVRVSEPMPMRPVSLIVHRDLQHASRVRVCCDMLVDGIRAQADRLAGRGRGRAAGAASKREGKLRKRAAE
jgi:DNA-binding transcriptional LysR family regulator